VNYGRPGTGPAPVRSPDWLTLASAREQGVPKRVLERELTDTGLVPARSCPLLPACPDGQAGREIKI